MISVIVPIYNSDNFLGETLASISEQSYSDFEVLLIDDGSTDKSKDICIEFVQKDDRFRYYYKENSGVADARNFGLDLVNGDYIAFIDSDDTVTRDYLEVLFNNLVKYRVDISVCNIENKNDQPIHLITDIEFCSYQYLLWSSSLCNKLYKKDVFNELRFPSGMIFEDNYIFHHLYGEGKYALCITNEKLYLYRHNLNSITRVRFSSKRFYDFVKGYKLRMDFFKQKGLVIPYKQAQYELVDYLVGNYCSEGIVREDKEVVKLLKQNLLKSNIYYKTKIYMFFRLFFQS